MRNEFSITIRLDKELQMFLWRRCRRTLDNFASHKDRDFFIREETEETKIAETPSGVIARFIACDLKMADTT